MFPGFYYLLTLCFVKKYKNMAKALFSNNLMDEIYCLKIDYMKKVIFFNSKKVSSIHKKYTHEYC